MRGLKTPYLPIKTYKDKRDYIETLEELKSDLSFNLFLTDTLFYTSVILKAAYMVGSLITSIVPAGSVKHVVLDIIGEIKLYSIVTANPKTVSELITHLIDVLEMVIAKVGTTALDGALPVIGSMISLMNEFVHFLDLIVSNDNRDAERVLKELTRKIDRVRSELFAMVDESQYQFEARGAVARTA